jgi:hypothetical protein
MLRAPSESVSLLYWTGWVVIARDGDNDESPRHFAVHIANVDAARNLRGCINGSASPISISMACRAARARRRRPMGCSSRCRLIEGGRCQGGSDIMIRTPITRRPQLGGELRPLVIGADGAGNRHSAATPWHGPLFRVSRAIVCPNSRRAP